MNHVDVLRELMESMAKFKEGPKAVAEFVPDWEARIAALNAAIAALSVAQGQGWLPIESAPRDGRSVIWGRHSWVPQQGHWANGPVFLSEYDEDVGYLTPSFQPTHWMPLPAAPAQPDGVE